MGARARSGVGRRFVDGAGGGGEAEAEAVTARRSAAREGLEAEEDVDAVRLGDML